MKLALILSLSLFIKLTADDVVSTIKELSHEKKIVVDTKRVFLSQFPDAFNPSILEFGNDYLLTFRYCIDRDFKPWISYIGVVLLNEDFEPISEPKLLSTRHENSRTSSQSEDARIFTYRGRNFLIYNDNVDVEYPSHADRRDMFVAELYYENGSFELSAPRKLIYEQKYYFQYWQKNWIPFESNKMLMLTYSLNPHEVIYANLTNGMCYFYENSSADIDWTWGTLRGSTPPHSVNGEYLAFFHSGMITSSNASFDMRLWHYFMGAYTFSSEPPFQITKISPSPLYHEEFYTQSTNWKRVVFPGGFVMSDNNIFLAYGKDDCEMWIATIDRDVLLESLVSAQRSTAQ